MPDTRVLVRRRLVVGGAFPGRQFAAGGTDKVACGTLASFNPVSAAMWAWWYPTSWANGRLFMVKGNGGSGVFSMAQRVVTAVNQIQVDRARATTWTLYRTNNANVALNRWYFCLVIYDSATASPNRVQVWLGTTRTPPVRLTFGTSTDGSGTESDLSARTMVLGNQEGGTTNAFGGTLAGSCGILDRIPDRDEINHLWRWSTDDPEACRLKGTRGLWVPGGNGWHKVEDLSGTGGHGTVTGTVIVPGLPRYGPRRPVSYGKAPAGNIVVTPSAAAARALGVSPTVLLGSLSITPTAGAARAQAVSPTVVLGSITITPATAAARALAVSPAIALGSLTLTPTAAIARALGLSPTVVLGALSLTPAAAVARALGVNPTVDAGGGGVLVTPAVAIARALAVSPTVLLGSMTVAPAAAIAKALGVSPTVLMGSLTLSPVAAIARAQAVTPVVVLGSLVLIPVAAIARALGVDPTAIGGAILHAARIVRDRSRQAWLVVDLGRPVTRVEDQSGPATDVEGH